MYLLFIFSHSAKFMNACDVKGAQFKTNVSTAQVHICYLHNHFILKHTFLEDNKSRWCDVIFELLTSVIDLMSC